MRLNHEVIFLSIGTIIINSYCQDDHHLYQYLFIKWPIIFFGYVFNDSELTNDWSGQSTELDGELVWPVILLVLDKS